jgi:hypothetical protein
VALVLSLAKTATTTMTFSACYWKEVGRRNFSGGFRQLGMIETLLGAGFGVINKVKQEPREVLEKDEVFADEAFNQPTTGIAGMRALWRKGRQPVRNPPAAKRKRIHRTKWKLRLAAAVVAKFLSGGKDDGDPYQLEIC